MRNLVIGVLAASTIAGSALAAPVYAPPPPIPAFSWEGFYAGGQVGYGFGSDKTFANVPAVPAGGGFPPGGCDGPCPIGEDAIVPAPGFPGASFAQSYSPNGVMGGGHAGYNFANKAFLGSFLGPHGVFGIEGDVDGADYSKTASGIPYGLSATDYARIHSDIQGSVRGRLGIAVERALLYVTGGAAFGDFKTTYNVGGVGFDHFSHSLVGYTVGAGVEYAFTNNVALRLEYRYSDFGSFTDALVNSSPVPGTTVHHHETQNRVQVGISYLFATPVAPVVARY